MFLLNTLQLFGFLRLCLTTTCNFETTVKAWDTTASHVNAMKYHFYTDRIFECSLMSATAYFSGEKWFLVTFEQGNVFQKKYEKWHKISLQHPNCVNISRFRISGDAPQWISVLRAIYHIANMGHVIFRVSFCKHSKQFFSFFHIYLNLLLRKYHWLDQIWHEKVLIYTQRVKLCHVHHVFILNGWKVCWSSSKS